MKNHFYFAYVGNKRDEVEKIMEIIKPYLETFGTTCIMEPNAKPKTYYNLTIVEPFAGSSAISYYISTLYPGKFKYILNDNNKKLIDLYKLVKSKKYKKLENSINKLVINFNKLETNDQRKIYYKEIINMDDLPSYIFINKYYSIRAGLCPLFEKSKQLKEFKIQDYPITNFLLNENITFSNIDGGELVKTLQEDKTKLIILDPPYLQTCNDFYTDKNLNIYEYLYKSNINNWKAQTVLILENIWINKLLFASNKISEPYYKNYQTSKKKTEHIIITQKPQIN